MTQRRNPHLAAPQSAYHAGPPVYGTAATPPDPESGRGSFVVGRAERAARVVAASSVRSGAPKPSVPSGFRSTTHLNLAASPSQFSACGLRLRPGFVSRDLIPSAAPPKPFAFPCSQSHSLELSSSRSTAPTCSFPREPGSLSSLSGATAARAAPSSRPPTYVHGSAARVTVSGGIAVPVRPDETGPPDLDPQVRHGIRCPGHGFTWRDTYRDAVRRSPSRLSLLNGDGSHGSFRFHLPEL